MAAISVRDLDDDVKERLRVRAARHGRSLEAEVRVILAAAVPANDRHLGRALLEAFGDDGIELDIPPRRSRPRGLGS